MEADRRETERLKRVIDMMLTMHSVLSECYKWRNLLVEILLLVTSVMLLVTNFADASFLTRIDLSADTVAWWGKAGAVVVFVVALIMLKVDWQGKASEHGRARDELVRLKGRCREVLGKGDDPAAFSEHQRVCNATMAVLCPIPEKKFPKLKAVHLRKVEISRMISRYPGCPVFVLWGKLFFEASCMALKGKKDSAEHIKAKERAGA